MTVRRVLLLLASVGLAAVLLGLLIRLGKIDVRLTLHEVESVSPTAFGKLVFLNVLLVTLSTVKWRSVDAALRSPSDSVPSRTTSFALTSVGMALGLLLPVQLGMATARTLGTYFHGRPLRRGTAGKLLEQSFDILIVALLAVASGITRYSKSGAGAWLIVAACMVVLALLSAGSAARFGRQAAVRLVRSRLLQNRIGEAMRSLSELESSSVQITRLARRLITLSTVRFVVVVLMANQTAKAIGAQIPLWHMAAAIPFGFIAMLIAVTPGGLGLNELTSATVLSWFGTPLAVAARWTLANRILGTASCFIVAIGGLGLLTVERLWAPKSRYESRETKAGGA